MVFWLWKQLFAASYTYYWSEASTIAIEMNGCDCDLSMYDIVAFYFCHVTTFWNLIGSGSNSLNSWKLPGRFTYCLKLRLVLLLASTSSCKFMVITIATAWSWESHVYTSTHTVGWHSETIWWSVLSGEGSRYTATYSVQQMGWVCKHWLVSL